MFGFQQKLNFLSTCTTLRTLSSYFNTFYGFTNKLFTKAVIR